MSADELTRRTEHRVGGYARGTRYERHDEQHDDVDDECDDPDVEVSDDRWPRREEMRHGHAPEREVGDRRFAGENARVRTGARRERTSPETEQQRGEELRH